MDTNPNVNSLSNLLDENLLETGLDRLNKQNKVLVVIDESLFDKNANNNKFSGPGVKKIHFGNIDKESKETLYDVILSGVMGHDVPCNIDLLSAYIELLAPGGILLVKTKPDTQEKLYKTFKMCGFLNVVMNNNTKMIAGNAPSYKIGSSDKVTLNIDTKENVISAWKLDDNNSETISEDDLLEADDLKKPASSSLRVCATTKKAKACKDCSCGLAEELEAASKLKDAPKPDTSNAKSSCGSCYLGDAFRCASCPYLGMPAFKPGEKVQLAGNLLKDDF